MKKAIIAVLAGLALSGCKDEPVPADVFSVSTAEAFKRLYHHPFTEFMEDRQCGILIYLNRKSYVQDKSITWLITSSGRHMLSFTVDLTPVETGKTKISVSVSKEANGREAYDGLQEYPRPAVKQPVRPAIEAQVAQVLAGRKYDVVALRRHGGENRVCNIQRSGVEAGIARFRVDDLPGHDTASSNRIRAQGR